jgi:hypothetical protein
MVRLGEIFKDLQQNAVRLLRKLMYKVLYHRVLFLR